MVPAFAVSTGPIPIGRSAVHKRPETPGAHSRVVLIGARVRLGLGEDLLEGF